MLNSGARLGGEIILIHIWFHYLPELISLSVIKIALGEKPDIEPKWNKGSQFDILKQTLAGVIKSIDGIEKAEKLNGVRQINQYRSWCGRNNKPMTQLIKWILGLDLLLHRIHDANLNCQIKDCTEVLEQIDVMIEEAEMNQKKSGSH